MGYLTWCGVGVAIAEDVVVELVLLVVDDVFVDDLVLGADEEDLVRGLEKLLPVFDEIDELLLGFDEMKEGLLAFDVVTYAS